MKQTMEDKIRDLIGMPMYLSEELAECLARKLTCSEIARLRGEIALEKKDEVGRFCEYVLKQSRQKDQLAIIRQKAGVKDG